MRRPQLFCLDKGKHLKNTKPRACKVKERIQIIQAEEDLNYFPALSRYSKSNTISKWLTEHLNLCASNWRYFSLEKNLPSKMRLISWSGLSSYARVTKLCALWKLIRAMSQDLLDHSKFCSHFCLDILRAMMQTGKLLVHMVMSNTSWWGLTWLKSAFRLLSRLERST